MFWEDLSIKEKSDLMRLYISNGIMDLDSIKKHYNSFATGGSLPDHDPKNPYHYHDTEGNKVVISPEDWEANVGKHYFREIEAAVRAEQAAHPGPEYEVNPDFVRDLRSVYKNNMGNNYQNYRYFASALPEGYSFTDEGLIVDPQGNYYVQSGFKQSPRFTYDSNSPLQFTINKGKPIEKTLTFYPVNMDRRVKASLPVDNTLNIEAEKEKIMQSLNNTYSVDASILGHGFQGDEYESYPVPKGTKIVGNRLVTSDKSILNNLIRNARNNRPDYNNWNIKTNEASIVIPANPTVTRDGQFTHVDFSTGQPIIKQQNDFNFQAGGHLYQGGGPTNNKSDWAKAHETELALQQLGWGNPNNKLHSDYAAKDSSGYYAGYNLKPVTITAKHPIKDIEPDIKADRRYWDDLYQQYLRREEAGKEYLSNIGKVGLAVGTLPMLSYGAVAAPLSTGLSLVGGEGLNYGINKLTPYTSYGNMLAESVFNTNNELVQTALEFTNPGFLLGFNAAPFINNQYRGLRIANELRKGVNSAKLQSKVTENPTHTRVYEPNYGYKRVQESIPTLEEAYQEAIISSNPDLKYNAWLDDYVKYLADPVQDNYNFIERANKYFYNYPPIQYNDEILRNTAEVNRLVRDRIAEHNTFLRGVRDPAMSPHNYDRKNADAINKQLDALGLPKTHENRLIYAATHYAPQTGSGRAGVTNSDVTGSLYTSNSLNTAAGYAMSHDLKPVGEVAMVRRPYTLGPDRNKWLEEGDFNLYANDYRQQDFDRVIRSYIKELKSSGEYTSELSKKEINNIYDKFYKGVYGIYDAQIDDLNKKLSNAGLDFRFNKSIKPTAKELLWTKRLSNTNFIIDPRHYTSPYEYIGLDDLKYATKLDDLIRSLEGVKTLKMGIFDPTKKQGFRALKPKDIESIIPKDKNISELSQMPLSEELKTFLNSIDNYDYLRIKSSKPYIVKGRIKSVEPNDEHVKKFNKSLGYKLHKKLQSYISPEDVRIFESKFDKYKNLMQHNTESENYVFTTEGLRVSKPDNAYQHYIFRGPAGEKALDFIKFIPKDEYLNLENINRMHEGTNYPGVSRKTFDSGGNLNKINNKSDWAKAHETELILHQLGWDNPDNRLHSDYTVKDDEGYYAGYNLKPVTVRPSIQQQIRDLGKNNPKAYGIVEQFDPEAVKFNNQWGLGLWATLAGAKAPELVKDATVKGFKTLNDALNSKLLNSLLTAQSFYVLPNAASEIKQNFQQGEVGLGLLNSGLTALDLWGGAKFMKNGFNAVRNIKFNHSEMPYKIIKDVQNATNKHAQRFIENQPSNMFVFSPELLEEVQHRPIYTSNIKDWFKYKHSPIKSLFNVKAANIDKSIITMNPLSIFDSPATYKGLVAHEAQHSFHYPTMPKVEIPTTKYYGPNPKFPEYHLIKPFEKAALQGQWKGSPNELISEMAAWKYNKNILDTPYYLLGVNEKQHFINKTAQRFSIPYIEASTTLDGLSRFGFFQKGGSLRHITPYGQWQYPHQVTTIPSNNITMKGVDYPVLGVSDTGDTKYMLPNMDYLFNGNYVTEYPINK